jgi:hypothetical protein
VQRLLVAALAAPSAVSNCVETHETVAFKAWLCHTAASYNIDSSTCRSIALYSCCSTAMLLFMHSDLGLHTAQGKANTNPGSRRHASRRATLMSIVHTLNAVATALAWLIATHCDNTVAAVIDNHTVNTQQ